MGVTCSLRQRGVATVVNHKSIKQQNQEDSLHDYRVISELDTKITTGCIKVHE